MAKPTQDDHDRCEWAADIMRRARKVEMAPDVYAALSDTVYAFEHGTSISRLQLKRARQAVAAFESTARDLQQSK